MPTQQREQKYQGWRKKKIKISSLRLMTGRRRRKRRRRRRKRRRRKRRSRRRMKRMWRTITMMMKRKRIS